MANNKTKVEGNDVVLMDLGIYSDDSKEDELINKKLVEYLKSMDYEMPKIKLDLDDEKVKSKG